MTDAGRHRYSGQPRLWLLLGPKPGDNNQILALAAALGWPAEEKHLRYRRSELISNQFLGPNLVGLNQAHCSPLTPPWPDLVLSAGRRNEPIARWIRRQAQRGRQRGAQAKTVKLVHLGRPWASLRHFDLVIATPQYQLPHTHNVLHNSLPLHHITRKRLDAAATPWRDRLAGLPAPYIVLLVGGDSGTLTLDQTTTARLLDQAQSLAAARGGSLLISSSRRTPPAARRALAAPLRIPGQVHQWSADDSDNPYMAWLGLADEFIVTGESVSMLTEACATGQPVSIFCPGQGTDAGNPMPTTAGRTRRQRFVQISNHHAPRRWRRDISAIHGHLIEQGRAVWLGDPPPSATSADTTGDLMRATQRIRHLLGRPSR